jgi:hypothetical protein
MFISPRKMTFLAREDLELVDGVAELAGAAEFADDFRHILPASSLKLRHDVFPAGIGFC